MNLENLPQPPEGVLYPDQPWYKGKIRDVLWQKFKAKLTGRPLPDGSSYTTTVYLTEADADKLIENLKKDPRGYPQFNDTIGGAEFFEAYEKFQKWLVEEYLEKPFREQTNKKIEEAEIEARIQEIQEERKQNVVVPVPAEKEKKEEIQAQEEEQKVLDSEQEAIEEETTKITTELDEVEKEEKNIEPEPTEAESPTLSSDIEAISDSLVTIKGALSNQISDLGSIERDSIKSLSVLEGIKQLFQAQTDIIRREIDLAEQKTSEKQLEQTQTVSGTDEATSTIASNKAEGIIQGIEGPVLTVKTTEGEFKKGEKISQGGGGGGGLLDMLKGIAGKFLTRGKGGGGAGGASGGSPIKMSGGGFLNTPFPASAGAFPATPIPGLAAGGTFAPGVYNKPTRGNLGPGQAVVPLNRNIGKKMFSGNLKQTLKLQQPLADVMAQPLKAIGLSIISVAGNFLKLLGPLAGFFTPYISGLVSGFAAVLGVPVAIVTSLLGGPAYAAMEDQDKQQNVFAKLWSELMKKLGISLGGAEEKEGEKKKDQTGVNGPENFEGSENAQKAYNYFISKGLTPEQSAGIVGNLMQESGSKIDPKADRGSHRGIAQWDYADRWNGLVNGKSFAGKKWEGVGKEGADKLENQLRYIYWEIETGAGGMSLSTFKNAKTVEQAASDFVKKYERSGEVPGTEGFDNRVKNAKGVLAKYNISAESGGVGVMGNSPLGAVTDWTIVDGPDSGYKVNDNLTMHGKEAYLKHQNGFTILPMENNQFSLSKKPQETLSRWKELLGPGQSSIGNGSFAAKGTRQVTEKSSVENAASLVYFVDSMVTNPIQSPANVMSKMEPMISQPESLPSVADTPPSSTNKGIERILTTPTAATNTTPAKNTSLININIPTQPQQIILPIPVSSGITIMSPPTRSIQKDLELMTAKTLC